MGIIFGKKKPPSRVTQQDKAVLQLKQQRDKLKQYQKRIEGSLTSDRLLARKLLEKGQRERARVLLKKKRFQEQMLQKTDGQLENITRLTQELEFAQFEVQIVDGLKQGSDALKKLNESFNIEDIERILEETREGAEKQQEITDLLSGTLTDEDDVAIETELQDILGETLVNVPSGKISVDVEEEEPSTIEKVKERKKQTPTLVEAS